MKQKKLLTRIFGGGGKSSKWREELRKEPQAPETTVSNETSDDEVKRNADFWNSVNQNMGDAHAAAALLFIRPGVMCSNADRAAYQKTVLFAGLITSTNGAMERAKAKYHTDDLFQIFRNVKMEDLG